MQTLRHEKAAGQKGATMEKKEFKVAALLKPGKTNATTTDELLLLTGFRSPRELQAEIARERNAGALIMSGGRAGYWLPSSREELEAFVKYMDSRAKNVFKAVQSAREALKTMPGQVEMFTDEGGLSE